jgi:hypothetical protein
MRYMLELAVNVDHLRIIADNADGLAHHPVCAIN